ncbi:MAG: 50S ribosomal protein L29 [Candidatus Nanoarchaeia archaeon]
MKFADIKKLSPQDKEKKIKEAKVELLKLQGQVQTGTAPKNPGKISQLKKLFAQIKTFEQEEAKRALKNKE